MNDSLMVVDRVDVATITASSGSAAGFSTANLQDGRYATLWKAGDSSGNQTLQFVFPIDRKVTSILIANHNFSTISVDEIDLEYWNGSSWIFMAVISPGDDPIFKNGLNQTRTTYRLIFKKAAGALSSPPQCGMIFLEEEVPLPLYLNDAERGFKSDIIFDEALSGLPYASASAAPRQTWKIDWGAFKASHNFQFWRLISYQAIGLHPFWMRDMDDHFHFVRMKMNNVNSRSNGNVSFGWRGIVLEEERVNAQIQLPGGYSV